MCGQLAEPVRHDETDPAPDCAAVPGQICYPEAGSKTVISPKNLAPSGLTR